MTPNLKLLLMTCSSNVTISLDALKHITNEGQWKKTSRLVFLCLCSSLPLGIRWDKIGPHSPLHRQAWKKCHAIDWISWINCIIFLSNDSHAKFFSAKLLMFMSYLRHLHNIGELGQTRNRYHIMVSFKPWPWIKRQKIQLPPALQTIKVTL